MFQKVNYVHKVKMSLTFILLNVCYSLLVGSVNGEFLEGLSDDSKQELIKNNHEINNFNSISYDEGCDCGTNATKCEYKAGLKTCTCEKGYVPGVNEICTEMCDDIKMCTNGGTCYNGICLCPPRTEGTFCEKVHVVCWNYGDEYAAGYRGLHCCCPDKIASTPAKCLYDVKNFNAYCYCPSEGEVYDDSSNKCLECSCGSSNTYSKCDFYNGVKTCFCNKNYEYNLKTKICEPCNCGSDSKKCEFSWSGEIKCNCLDGYYQWKNKCIKCDCGTQGSCELRDGKPICHCFENAQKWNETCLGCDCGTHGNCIYSVSGEKEACDCEYGYAEFNGKCEYCYCGDESKCSFNSSGAKICECRTGYEDVNGFCSDINECLDYHTCSNTSRCVNTPGSYNCDCGVGFIQTPYGCQDIDECKAPEICGTGDTECVNTIGSFNCQCKSGYVSQGGERKYLKCADHSTYKFGYGILGVFLFSLTWWIFFFRQCS